MNVENQKGTHLRLTMARKGSSIVLLRESRCPCTAAQNLGPKSDEPIVGKKAMSTVPFVTNEPHKNSK
jgi:hypothetical protein